MPRTARETFIGSGHKAKFEEISQTPAFEAACHFTLLALMEEAPERFKDMSDSWQTGVFLAGARRAMEVLSNLHKKEEAPEKTKPRSLNYNA